MMQTLTTITSIYSLNSTTYMKRLILILLVVILGVFANAQVQPPFIQRTNGTYTPIDPWLSVPRGLNVSNVLPSITTEAEYEIALIPDIQKMTRNFPLILDRMFQWFHDSASYYNIKAIIQLGDITDFGTVAHFQVASDAFKHIDSTGIPYMAIIGNHDYDSMIAVPNNVPNRIATNYNTFFGPSRYVGKPFYGGNFEGKNENFYIKFDIGTQRFIAIGLEFIPRNEALDWAQRVLDSFPDRKAIITSHNYISFYGEKSVDTTIYSTDYYHMTGNAGQAMWDKLIKKNPQIILVAGAHQIHRDLFVPIVQRIVESGTKGNVVNQILTNYQDDTNGGNGYFMRVRIKPSTAEARMSMFSPTLQLTDTRFPPFTLGYPETRITPVLGISASGGLNNAGETRLDSFVYITRLPLNHFLYTGPTGRLDTLPAQAPHKFLASGIGITNTNATFRGIDTTDLPTDSTKYVLNKLGTTNNTQTGNFVLSKPSAIISDLVKGGMPGLSNSGLPAMLQIVQPSGNWGINIARAGNNGANPWLSFYKTRGLTADIKVPVQAGDILGGISWQGVAGNGTTTEEAGRLNFGTDTVLAGWPSGFIAMNFSGRGGILTGTKFYFSSRGWLGVNTAVPETNLDVNGNVIVRTFYSNDNNSTNWLPVVSDATGHLSRQTQSSPLVFTGTAAPLSTPINIGDIYVDTVNKKLYFATGTTSSADWTISNP